MRRAVISTIMLAMLCLPARANPDLPRAAIFASHASRTYAVVSPDGSRIAFIAPNNGAPNIWIAPAIAANDARPLTAEAGAGIATVPYWSSDGKYVLISRTIASGARHMFAVDVETGLAKDLLPSADGNVSVCCNLNLLDPAEPGHVLLLVGRPGHAANFVDVDVAAGTATKIDDIRQTATDVVLFATHDKPIAILHLARGGARELRLDLRSGWKTVLTWGEADSDSTGFITTDPAARTAYLRSSVRSDKARLILVDLSNGRTHTVVENDEADVLGVWFDYRTGALDGYDAKFGILKHVGLTAAGRRDVARIESVVGPQYTIFSRSRDGRVWTLQVSDSKKYAYYLYDCATGVVSKLFDAWPEFADRPLRPMEAVTIRARDGLLLHSYLTLPAGTGDAKRPDRPVPLVVLVHGGPINESDTDTLQPLHQWLANRGYGVLSVNFRGSNHFGKAFFRAAEHEMGAKMETDLFDAVDWAVARGIADRTKIAIMGGSYGGYAALDGLMTAPDKFACAVDDFGPTDLIKILDAPNSKNYPTIWKTAVWLTADPATDAGMKLLVARSPALHAERITKPLLISQGGLDAAVPKSQSDALVDGLRRLDRVVTYVVYPDEGHGFLTPANELSHWAIVEAFLGKCLGGNVEPFGHDLDHASLNVVTGAGSVPGLSEALAARAAH